MSVILTKASSAKAVVITRSLGRKGVKVINSDSSSNAAAFYSKYSSGNFQYHSPLDSEDKFLESLIGNISEYKADVLMPVHSEETYIISKFKNRLETLIRVPVPDYDDIQQVNDKSNLMKYADSLGIPIPKTYEYEKVSDLAHVNRPVVIKLRETTSSKGMKYVKNNAQLSSKLASTIKKYQLTPDQYPVVQDFFPGDGYGVEMLFNHGKLRAKFVHKRIREYPKSGGPSTVRISTRNKEMEYYAQKLLENLGWHGIAMVEFKYNKKTGQCCLLEVNPRFWGSINQAIVSGVNFPYLLYKMAVDGDVEPVMKYKLGVKTRFFLYDMRAFPSYLKASKNKARTIREFSRIRGYHYDDISLYDPMPAIKLALQNRKGLF